MTSVWFAASGSGEDGDPWDVHEVFATKDAAQAHCDRPDRPTWEHRYVQEWEVTGSMLTDEEREAVKWAVSAAANVMHPADVTLRKLLERMT